MKTRSKALVLTLCAVLLVVATVMGTMAYLTSTDSVTNTFTVGKVAITLDEAKVNPNGTPVADADRVKANAYKLIPGHSYTKDPTVHVTAGSEDSYIFVKVENGIAAFEAAGDKAIAKQIEKNQWNDLKGVTGVYYKEYTSANAQKDLVVFENFEIANTAGSTDAWNNVNPQNTKVTVTAYAVQKDGFADANAAWTATFGAPANP